MSRQSIVLLVLACVCLVVFASLPVFTMLTHVPGERSFVPVWAASAWLASGYLGLALCYYFNHVDVAHRSQQV